MYCVKCGTKAEKGQKLCLECGMRLVSPEALLKLLKKADLEKKLSQIDQISPVKAEKGEGFIKGYMDRMHQDEQKAKTLKKQKEEEIVKKRSPEKKKTSPDADEKVIKKKTQQKKESVSEERVKKKPVKREAFPEEKVKTAPEKQKKLSEEKEKKRVTPLYENPTQPGRKSIFDDDAVSSAPRRTKSAGGSGKPSKNGKTASGAQKPKEKHTNPVVKLPEKKKTMAESRRKDEREAHVYSQKFLIPQREETSRKPYSAGKNEGAKRVSERTGVKRPDRMKGALHKTQSSEKTIRPAQKKSASGGSKAKKQHSKREEESFAEKYLRSIISMMLLTCTVVMMLMWGYATDSGLRTMAELGLGSRKGYILLGDDCMRDGNYKRAVEHYYKALSQRVNYEAGIKLANAYRQTGEAEKETSALLLLMDRYEGMDEPYNRILELYPNPDTRPEKVQTAISMHER